MLKQQSPRLRVVVSYADPEQEHFGAIYQAGNWTYLGETPPVEWFVTDKGRRVHTKTVRTGRRGYATKLKEAGAIRAIHLTKHKYAYPLDAAMRRQLGPVAKPYPKRATSLDSEASANHAEEGGASPTVALSDS
jgi:hypothetical protein